MIQNKEALAQVREDAKKTLFDIETKEQMNSTTIQINETKLIEEKKKASITLPS